MHIDYQHLAAGQHRAPCPVCNHGPRDTALAIRVDPDGAVWLCHRCGLRGGSGGNNNVRAVARPVVRTANRDDAIGKRENARRVWDECVPLKDSPGADYLRLRQCALPPDDGDLRFHPALRCGELDQKFPALIGKVTTVQGEIFVGIHRVWFRPGVAKAAKKMRLGGSDQPVCIRLWPDDLVTTGLGIAEGIETALAAATMFRPMWSTIDAGQMASFPVLRGIESLTIFADNDASGTGLKAAQTCATTWMKAGVQVRVLLPKILGEDANDVVRRISGVQS